MNASEQVRMTVADEGWATDGALRQTGDLPEAEPAVDAANGGNYGPSHRTGRPW